MTSKPDRIRSWRLFFICAFFTLGVAMIIERLYQVQVVETPRYQGSQIRQSLRRVQIPGQRGRIFDRHGICLADNRASYCVALYAEELRRSGNWTNTINAVDAQVDTLAALIGKPRQVSAAAVARHVRQSLPMPLVAWRDLDEEAIARVAERQESLAGVDILVEPARRYPNGALAAHVIGYVGRDKPVAENSDEPWHYHVPDMVGRAGIERMYDQHLHGTPGEQILQVDARGYRHKGWIKKPARNGNDLHLTLDFALQRTLETQLEGKRGAGVALDPRNGDVLAMASSPAFDLSDMVPFITSAVWNRLNTDPARPLLNRAVQGLYPPGSVFKPFTALAALKSGIPDDWNHFCDGRFKLGNHFTLRCASRHGHGEVALHAALAQSCNPYFCAVANEIGFTPIFTVARDAGFGALTGIDLDGELPGRLPTPEWKKNRGEYWVPGDTCQISIGQGALTATPLQVASAIGAIAMYGRVMKPRLVAGTVKNGVVEREIAWPRKDVSKVINGMIGVAENGTGRRVRLEGIQVAAKTGSAEYNIAPGDRRKHTWVAAFAPAQNPEIVVAVVIEDGQSGGLTTAPLVRNVLAAHFGAAAASAAEPRAIGLEADD